MDQEFDSARDRQSEACHWDQLARLGALLGVNRHRINAHDLERLGNSIVEYLQVEDRIRCAVGNAPEFRFPGLHVENRGRKLDAAVVLQLGINGYVVDADVLERNAITTVAPAFA